MKISVPAKGMLFGEYGVLKGGAAAVVTMNNKSMDLRFQCMPSLRPQVTFSSNFLAGDVCLKPSEIVDLISGHENSESRKLACYLAGWQRWIADKSLNVNVDRSFSPELGFGTSSAILVAFQTAMQCFSSGGHVPEEILFSSIKGDFWQRLHDALIHLQGKGSGYDVAVQIFALFNRHQATQSASVYCFQNHGFKQGRFVPEVKPVGMSSKQLSALGCFVQTGVRSDTTTVLAKTQSIQGSDEFCSLQDEWARSFCADPSLENAKQLCMKASMLSVEHGLLPSRPELIEFVRLCERKGIAWKTMGAGHGDCLWVLASKPDIEELIRGIGASSMHVAFSFDEGV
ncbi:MAG: hypothetical protein ACO3A4_10755 [Silvanigrellaceae bacterium]